jgi:prepilin-type N-terminal cleavage/methylation domain-containing protein
MLFKGIGTTPLSNHNDDKGLSILELIVVVAVIGLLSMVAIPSMKPLLEDIRLRTSANSIKHQLYIAKSRALGDSQVHCGIFFDTINKPNTIQTFLDDGAPANNNQYDPGKDHLFMDSYKLPPTVKLQIGGAGHNNVIVFRGDGSAKVRGLTLTIRNSLNKTKTISVLSSTGRIKLF